jgi:hypothetical protein
MAALPLQSDEVGAWVTDLFVAVVGFGIALLAGRWGVASLTRVSRHVKVARYL